MTRQVHTDARTWRSHPVRAFLIRAVAFLIPLGASVVVGLVVGAMLPAPQGRVAVVLWWAAVLASSTLALYGTDRLTRRLLPLATLMRLSMLFPDHAPSRVKLARRVTGSRAIAVELEKARRAGVSGDRQQAAETILALVGALGDYDSRTRGHSERTQLFVTLLADELKLKAEDKGRLMWAALVHDIGKLKVPTEVLNKPGKPSPEEWAALHHHPEHGAEICAPLQQWLGEWWPAIEQHHEKYDGSGYPRGLAGAEISYGARIVSVADSYEVMTAARPYKRPMTAEAAREELTRCAGTQFDPDVVRAFLNISLGRLSRSAGPIAWIAQLLMVRPGPLLGQVMGGAAGAAAAAAGVVGLNLAPSAGDVPAPAGDRRPPAAAPAAPGPAAEPSAEPTRRPQRPPRPVPTPVPTPGPTAAPTTVPTEVPARAPEPAPVSLTPEPTPLVTLTPEPVPVAVGLSDDVSAVDEDDRVQVHVLANDLAGDHGPLRVTAVGAPAHGTATRTLDHAVLYVPDADYHGGDAFTYTAQDTAGTTLTARVTVTVRATPDAPVAVDDTVSLPEDSAEVTFDPAVNDTDADGDPLTVTSVTGAARGTLVARGGGRWGYTPDPDFHGTETLSYTVADGTGRSATGAVRVTVTPVNDPPTAADDAFTVAEDSGETTFDPAANDTDADGDPLTVTSVTGAARGTLVARGGGRWGYTPDPDFHGTETLTYLVGDGQGGSASGTVRITVTPVPDPPVAVDDAVTVAEDAVEVTFDPAANDTDADGDALTVSSVTGAVNGVLTAKGGNTWGYTPDQDFHGTESLSYTVADGTGRTDTGTITITVTPEPDAPSAGPDAYSVELGQTLTVAAAGGVLANDHDADGDTLTVVGHDAPFTLNPDGSFSFTPSTTGTVVVTYQVSDGSVTSNGTMTVTVTAAAPTQRRLYLEPAANNATGLLLDTPPPANVADWDSDGRPGLTIDDSDMKPDETNHDKFQVWSYPVTSAMTLNGPVTLDLWTRLEKGALKDLDYAAWVYDCDTGGVCTLLTSAVDVHVNKWSTSTDWEKRTVTIGSVTRVVPAGHTIRVRLAFDHSEVFLPLGDDPATPAADESTSSLNLTLQ